MAGINGTSGGARKNSGGVRKDAGRKEKPKKTINLKKSIKDPKQFLLRVMDDTNLEDRLRIDAAKTLMPYIYLKLGDGGIKSNKKNAANKASTGKFRPSLPPKIRVMQL